MVGSLDKQMQNEKELIRLASAGVGGLFCIFVGSINLTWRLVSSGILQVVGVPTRLDLKKIRKKTKVRKFPISPEFP